MVDGSEDANHSEALNERDAYLRTLLEIAFDGTIISENGVVVEISRELLDFSGYKREEVIGRPLTDFVAPEFHETIHRRQAAGTEGHLDAIGILKDGRRRDVEIVTRNHNARGRTIRITALRDVTEKRLLEEQLRQVQKMESLGRLASGIVHDFNNVLMVIRNCADILVEDLDEPGRSDAIEIRQAAELGSALTRQLLAYSRQQGVKVSKIDVNAVVRESGQLLKRVIGSGIEFRTDLERSAVMVCANTGQLQQLMFNLAANARDAMPAGGKLVVRTRAVELQAGQLREYTPAQPGRYVMLAMSDSGTGIPADVRARMFEPFFTTKEPGGGTGLGLFVVKAIVEQNRGFLVVDSTMAAGTTFAIYIPADES